MGYLGQTDQPQISDRIEENIEKLDAAFELAKEGEGLAKDVRSFIRRQAMKLNLSPKGAEWPKVGKYGNVQSPAKMCRIPNASCVALPMFNLDVGERLAVLTDNGVSWLYVVNTKGDYGYVLKEDVSIGTEPVPSKIALQTDSPESRSILEAGITGSGSGSGSGSGLIPVAIAALAIGVLFGGRR